jgi:DNA polymerase elongation subunit (family B)
LVVTISYWGNAIVNGQPFEVPAWDCKKYQLIDTYTQTALYDFLVSKLTSYSLKEAPVQFGIKDENERKHDIGADVYQYWEKGDTETIVAYLREDLDDTELLWNYLLPQKYFMKSYMDWDLKRITTTGTGSWWLQFYKKQTETEIPRIDKCGYTGALTYYKAGIYKKCCKYDFSGLYPSIMLTYLISMKWDKDYFLLKALKFLITYRKSIKKTQAFIDYDN